MAELCTMTAMRTFLEALPAKNAVESRHFEMQQYAANKLLGACPICTCPHIWGHVRGLHPHSGARGRIRTHNPLIRSQMLYPLSYAGSAFEL